MTAPPSLIEDLRAVAQGDRQGWERLVQALASRLHGAAYRILGDAHAAEDATQDAFLALGRAADGFRGEDDAAVERWAVAIACRTSLQHARGRDRRERRVRTGLPAEAETMAAAIRRDEIDPHVLDAAMRALHRLPERHRLPIVLHVFGSLNGPELARELGVSANTARVRLHRALRKLQARLVGEGVTVAPAVLCTALASAVPPAPGQQLLASWSRLEWGAPPPAITPRRMLMASTAAAAGLAFVAWATFAHLSSASDAPASAPRSSAASAPDRSAPAAAAPEPAAPALSLAWQVAGPSNSFGATTPIIAGDAVLFCGSTELVCVDRQSGARRWSIPGAYQHSHPALDGDEAIVMRRDAVEAIALADGRRRWSAAVDGEDNDADVVVHEDRAYIATRAGTLWCLELTAGHQGEPVWKVPCAEPRRAAFAPGFGSRDDLVLPIWGSRLVCIDERSGQVRWSAGVPGLGAGSPVARAGLVYALAEDPASGTGMLVALDEATGAERWRRQVPQDRAAPPPTSTARTGADANVVIHTVEFQQGSIGAAAGPALAGDVLVVGSSTDLLGYALDGTLRWRVPFATFGYRTFSIDAAGRVWAGGDHGELLAVSAGGRVLLRTCLDRDPHVTLHPVTESTSDGQQSQSVGSVSNPGIDGGDYVMLTSGGVALRFSTSTQF